MPCTVCPKKSNRSYLGQNNSKGGGMKGSDLILPITILGGLLLINKLFASPAPPPPVPLPTGGEGLPLNWSPTPSATALYGAMKGAGTSEEIIWATLEGKTPDQLVAIYNEFNRLYFQEGNGDLFNWFKDDLSGDDLTRAMAYFVGTGLVAGMGGWLTTPGIDPARQFFNWNMYTWPEQYKKVVQELNTDLDMIARS